MKMKIINSANFYRVNFLAIFLIVFSTIFNMKSLTSLGFLLTFITTLGLLFYILSNDTFLKDEFINILILFIVISLGLIIVMRSIQNFQFIYYKKFIIFLSTLIYLFCISKINTDQKTVEFIIKINLTISIIYIFNYYLGNPEYLYGELSFGYSNPNLAGMWLLHSAMYTIIAFVYYKSKIFKLVNMFIFILLVKFIEETGARTSFISLIVFIIIAMIIMLIRKFKLKKFWCGLILWTPLIFSIIYMNIVKIGYINLFSFMESEGKSLTSRYEIWNIIYNLIKENILFGDYYGLTYVKGISQAHNSHLDILVSYGVIILILVMIYIYRIVIKINMECISTFQIINLIAFLTIIIMGWGEAALFSGGVGMYILSLGYLILAKYKNQEVNR